MFLHIFFRFLQLRNCKPNRVRPRSPTDRQLVHKTEMQSGEEKIIYDTVVQNDHMNHISSFVRFIRDKFCVNMVRRSASTTKYQISIQPIVHLQMRIGKTINAYSSVRSLWTLIAHSVAGDGVFCSLSFSPSLS